MNLSLYTGGVKPYLEYGWVCAPNTAGQSITANTITTLTIDTEIADTGNFGSIASNQITLAAGTYYFEGTSPIGGSGGATYSVLGLFSITASAWVSRTQIPTNSANGVPVYGVLKGQFTITSPSAFEMRAVNANAGAVGNSYWNVGNLSLATAGADQRTTIKLWKLA